MCRRFTGSRSVFGGTDRRRDTPCKVDDFRSSYVGHLVLEVERVVGAVDGDGHHLRGAVDGGYLEAVGQRVAVVERLHLAIGVVELVGPDAIRRHREGAIAARARLW